MDRRTFLALLAGGAATAVAGCAGPADHGTTPRPAAVSSSARSASAVSRPAALTVPAGPAGPTVPRPPGTLTKLTGPGRPLALTVDDGASSAVVGAYVKFAEDTGARFTFFVTGVYDSWRDHAARLRPLVESGQIQLGNHTWDHPDLTSLSASAVSEQLTKTKKFLHNTFGVDGTPYYRPPYGFHDTTVDRVAADLGYTAPTLWYGSLSDSGIITEKYLIAMGRKYFHPHAIVIGHANHPAVTHCYPQLVDIIKSRRLSMVTLNDVFIR